MRNLKFITLALLLVCASAHAVGSRTGGRYAIKYESMNAGGGSNATGGVYKLGGSIAQSGLIFALTNVAGNLKQGDGFWKMETVCEMYPPLITAVARATNSMAVTFSTATSNSYKLAYLNAIGGVHTWTNLAASVVAIGPVGSVTTLYDTAASATSRVYLIRCE